MAQRKTPELTTNFVTALEPAGPRRTVRKIKARVFQIPPEHLEGIREGLVQIERGEVLDEAELDALLAPDRL